MIPLIWNIWHCLHWDNVDQPAWDQRLRESEPHHSPGSQLKTIATGTRLLQAVYAKHSGPAKLHSRGHSSKQPRGWDSQVVSQRGGTGAQGKLHKPLWGSSANLCVMQPQKRDTWQFTDSPAMESRTKYWYPSSAGESSTWRGWCLGLVQMMRLTL